MSTIKTENPFVCVPVNQKLKRRHDNPASKLFPWRLTWFSTDFPSTEPLIMENSRVSFYQRVSTRSWNSLKLASKGFVFRADTLPRDYFSCVRDNASLKDRWLIALFRKEISQPSFQNKEQEYWVKQQLLIYEKLCFGTCAKSAFHLMKINLVVCAHKLMLWNFSPQAWTLARSLKCFRTPSASFCHPPKGRKAFRRTFYSNQASGFITSGD